MHLGRVAGSVGKDWERIQSQPGTCPWLCFFSSLPQKGFHFRSALLVTSIKIASGAVRKRGREKASDLEVRLNRWLTTYVHRAYKHRFSRALFFFGAEAKQLKRKLNCVLHSVRSLLLCSVHSFLGMVLPLWQFTGSLFGWLGRGLSRRWNKKSFTSSTVGSVCQGNSGAQFLTYPSEKKARGKAPTSEPYDKILFSVFYSWSLVKLNSLLFHFLCLAISFVSLLLSPSLCFAGAFCWETLLTVLRWNYPKALMKHGYNFFFVATVTWNFLTKNRLPALETLLQDRKLALAMLKVVPNHGQKRLHKCIEGKRCLSQHAVFLNELSCGGAGIVSWKAFTAWWGLPFLPQFCSEVKRNEWWVNVLPQSAGTAEQCAKAGQEIWL